MNLIKISVTEGATQKTLPAGNPLLQPGAQRAFGPVNHPGGIGADLPIQIEVDFSWPNRLASNAIANKTIVPLIDLDVQLQAISHTQHSGTVMPCETPKMTPEIQPTYQRENHIWIPQTTTEDINLP
jgi:hypothetical protein